MRTAFMCGVAHGWLDGNPDKPSFVNLWLDDPHTPWVPSADDQTIGKDGRATGRGDTKERLRGVMAQLDRQVGELLDSLRNNRAGRPTIVLFLSDNGPLPSFQGPGPSVCGGASSAFMRAGSGCRSSRGGRASSPPG